MNREQATAIWIMIIAAVFFSFAAFTTADPGAPETLTEVGSSSRDLTSLPAQSVDARGGNVTELNIESLTTTRSWQGYYGDISGIITLDDANNNTFYNWSVATTQGEVYATRASSITWGNVNCSTATNVTSEETYLGHAATDGDSVTNTFSLTAHPEFSIGSSVTIFTDTCPSTHAYVNNVTQASDWTQVLLHDQEQNIVYSTIINDTRTGFDGGTHDFQLLVGENEHTGQIGTTTYYFWVELD